MKPALAWNGRGRDKTKGLRPPPQRTQNNAPLLRAHAALNDTRNSIPKSVFTGANGRDLPRKPRMALYSHDAMGLGLRDVLEDPEAAHKEWGEMAVKTRYEPTTMPCGFTATLLEAMALGTPCIATDVTGIPEVLRHEETGLMVPQHDPAALAAAIERRGDRSLGRRLVVEARGLIEQFFDIHRNTAMLRALFGVPDPARIEAVGGVR